MKQGTVILSVNDHPNYLPFKDLTRQAWERLGYRVHIVDVGSETKCGVPYANWSKVARILEYATCGENSDQPVMVADVDSLPLRADPFDLLMALAAHDGDLIAYGWDAYEDDPYGDIRKFPGGNMVAQEWVWEQIVNHRGMPNEDLVDSWRGGAAFDQKEDPYTDRFSEESLIRRLVCEWRKRTGGKMIPIARGWRRTPQGIRAYNRIDRADWHIDHDKLAAGHYIDAHLPRPMSEHMDKIQPLVDYLGVEL